MTPAENRQAAELAIQKAKNLADVNQTATALVWATIANAHALLVLSKGQSYGRT